MSHHLKQSLEDLRSLYDRGPALILGFILLGVCWALAFVFDNQLCIVAAALCALFCLHVSNAKQPWIDAQIAASMDQRETGFLRVLVVPKGHEVECSAEVVLTNGMVWQYPSVRRAIPCLEPVPCTCYFKPGTNWPVIIVSADHTLLADKRPIALHSGLADFKVKA